MMIISKSTRNGIDMPLVGFGTYQLSTDQAEFCVHEALKAGFRHIGVSNYNEERLEEILDADLAKPEANQVEFHPICAQTDLTRYMKENLIAPIAYSCLAPLSTWRVEKGQGGEVLAEIKEECQLVVNEIAKKLKVSEAKLLLRWGLQHGYCVLTRSSKPERIRENLDVFEFEIPDNDMERLNRLNQNQAIAWAANGLNPMEAAPPLK